MMSCVTSAERTGYFEIAHFVTIGSPLGLPHVKDKIIRERPDANKKEQT